jgi:hypothetical protein
LPQPKLDDQSIRYLSIVGDQVLEQFGLGLPVFDLLTQGLLQVSEIKKRLIFNTYSYL